jgi:hypothetical protein
MKFVINRFHKMLIEATPTQFYFKTSREGMSRLGNKELTVRIRHCRSLVFAQIRLDGELFAMAKNEISRAESIYADDGVRIQRNRGCRVLYL